MPKDNHIPQMASCVVEKKIIRSLHVPYRILTPVGPRTARSLQEYKSQASKADWRNKARFPDSLKESIINLVVLHIKESNAIPGRPFFEALTRTMPYNLYTVTRYVARTCISKAQETIRTAAMGQVKDLGLLAKPLREANNSSQVISASDVQKAAPSLEEGDASPPKRT
jgi:hypothetical protein